MTTKSVMSTRISAVQYQGRRSSRRLNWSTKGTFTGSTGVMPWRPAVSVSPLPSEMPSPLMAKMRMISPKASVTIAM